MKEQQISPENPDIWVSHITGNSSLGPINGAFDIQCEELLQKVSKTLHDVYGESSERSSISEEDAKHLAVNLLTAEFLKLQREISPEGHQAHFQNCYAYHPDLKEFRQEIVDEAFKKIYTPKNFFARTFSPFKLVEYVTTAIAIIAGVALIDALSKLFG